MDTKTYRVSAVNSDLGSLAKHIDDTTSVEALAELILDHLGIKVQTKRV